MGRAAILAGYAVQFVTAMTLVASLAKAHAERRLEERLTNLAKPRLLIVDELGYLPLEPDAAHLFFQLVSRRYEKGAMLITSNRTISEWGTVFGDAVVATAILDRLLHHSHVVTIRGDSYRHCAAAHRHRHSLTEGISSSCRQGANSGCRLTRGAHAGRDGEETPSRRSRLPRRRSSCLALSMVSRPSIRSLEETRSEDRGGRRPSVLTPTAMITATETIRPFWRAFTYVASIQI